MSQISPPSSTAAADGSPFRFIRALLLEAITAIAAKEPAAERFAQIQIDTPRDLSHGDAASNIALVLARDFGLKPRDLADRLVAALVHPDIDQVTVAGPGFLNFSLTTDFWYRRLIAILDQGDAFGRSLQGRGEAVNIEYVSANPTGPLHIGHCRGAVFGDALADLLEFVGFKPCREYYINDAGAQIDALAESVYWRYRELYSAVTEPIPDGLYPGTYLIDAATALRRDYDDRLLNSPRDIWLEPARLTGIATMIAMIRQDLAALNIHHDIFVSERSLYNPDDHRVKAAIDKLTDAGLIYEECLPPPKGITPTDWTPTPLPLFRATNYGDEVDRPLQKSDGSYTYFASDIAYHYDKYCRGFAHQIDILGADHAGYVARIQGALTAMSDGKAHINALICQLVRFLRDGKPARMSKRAGNFVLLRDIVDEVGADAVRFMMLFRRNDATLDFDVARVTEQSRDNPVFYVQYAHARICSVFRGARRQFPELAAKSEDFAPHHLRHADMARLGDPAEMLLIRKISTYPDMLEAAAKAYEPHRIAYYLYDLAAAFHQLWNKGKTDAGLRFLDNTAPESAEARLALLAAVRNVLASGMRILGVRPVEEMI